MFALLFFIITPGLSSIIIQNPDSNLCISQSMTNGLVPLSSCCETCDTQNWIFKEHPDLKGYYKIINGASNRAIENTLTRDGITTTINDDDEETKYWEFMFYDEEHPDYFKMVNLARPNECIEVFKLSPTITHLATSTICTFRNNINWKFTEDYDIINIDFSLNEGLILSNTPFVAGSGICNNANGGSSEQEINVTVSETRTETSSFEHSHGFSITVGTTFETGIPFVANGEISTEISTSHDFVFGEETSVEKQFAVELPVRCSPGEIISVDCIIFTAEIDVPYTMTVLGVKSGVKFDSNGIFKGTTSYEFVCDFTHLNPNDNTVLFTERQLLTIE